VVHRPRLAAALVAVVTSAAPAAGTASLVSGCLPGGNVAAHVASTPTYEPRDQAKCGVAKSAAHPLIVEWPSADRATLEAKAQSGVVAVRYVGCEMEVIHRCRLPGKYAYTAITPKHDTVHIRDLDELYANMPVGAPKLEGKVEHGAKLDVSMTVVGRYEADRTTFSPDQLEGEDCSRATHVVSGMTTGAFELSASASAGVSGEVRVMGAGGGARSSDERETLERDGHEDKCESGGRGSGPPDGCGAVLRLDVVPLEAPRPKAPPASVSGEAASGAGALPGGPSVSLPPGEIAAGLYGEGNLRVTAFCAERTTVLTPEEGLRVFLDGKSDAERPLKPNVVTTMGTQTVNNRTVPVMMQEVIDVGFVVPPGPHHLLIRAPDCEPVDSDIMVSATHAKNVTVDMAVSNASLQGPTGAPAGFAWLVGGYGMTLPKQLVFKPAVTDVDGIGPSGGSGAKLGGAGLLAFTYERRYFTMGFLYGVGSGSYSGHTQATTTSGGSAGDYPFTGSSFQNMLELRAGVRLPLRYVALMAGSGIGGSMWINSYKVDTSGAPSGVFPETNLEGGIDFTWDLPLWAAIDIKPTCDFGFQVGGAYNVQPTNMDGNNVMIHAGLLWQPAPACSRTASFSISP
jgi:hypothetical protein